MFVVWFIDPCCYGLWTISDYTSSFFMVLTMHTRKYAQEFFYNFQMKRYGWLSKLDGPNLLIHQRHGMITRLKLQISIVKRWMPCLVLWLTRSLRRSHPLKVLMKHGQSFKTLMKVPKLSKIPSFKGLL